MQAGPYLQRAATESLRRALDAGRHISVGRGWPTALCLGLPVLLIGLLAWPLLFTNDSLSGDWLHSLTLIWSQSQEIQGSHHPSLYYNYSHAVLYPQFAFYGATIYAITGTLSLLIGGAPIAAYVLTYLLGFAAAYGGWYWLARMAGLGRWLAQAPGAIFITSGYYITLIYGRGDWPELVAVSTMPILIASSLSVLRADRLRFWPALALVASAIIFFGSHDLTVIWGSTVLVLLCVTILACAPEARRLLRLRRIVRVAGLIVPALLVNAWFLLPTIAYESHTDISHRYLEWRLTLSEFMPVVSASNLFALGRVSADPPNDAFVVALPVLVIAWILVGAVMLLRRGSGGAWARLLLVFAGWTALVAVVMTHAPLILALPRPYAILQFSYRLDSYVLLGISAAVLAVLVLAQKKARRPSILIWALGPLLVLAVAGAVGQAGASPGYGVSRQAAVKPSSKPGPREPGWHDYVDADLPLLPHYVGAPEIDFSVDSLRDDRASAVVHLQPGQTIYTNIGGGPELVSVTGAKIVGIDPEGNDVLEVGPSTGESAGGSASRGAPLPREVLAVGPASGLPIVLGRLLSFAAIAILAAELTALAIRRARAGGSRPDERSRPAAET
jgi:hypothetical protein